MSMPANFSYYQMGQTKQAKVGVIPGPAPVARIKQVEPTLPGGRPPIEEAREPIPMDVLPRRATYRPPMPVTRCRRISPPAAEAIDATGAVRRQREEEALYERGGGARCRTSRDCPSRPPEVRFVAGAGCSYVESLGCNTQKGQCELGRSWAEGCRFQGPPPPPPPPPDPPSENVQYVPGQRGDYIIIDPLSPPRNRYRYCLPVTPREPRWTRRWPGRTSPGAVAPRRADVPALAGGMGQVTPIESACRAELQAVNARATANHAVRGTIGAVIGLAAAYGLSRVTKVGKLAYVLGAGIGGALGVLEYIPGVDYELGARISGQARLQEELDQCQPTVIGREDAKATGCPEGFIC